jgi:hypothetical protein
MLPVISNDAVHSGRELSGDLSYGVDDTGTKKARAMDMEIITSCLVELVTKNKKHSQNIQ